MVAGETLAQLLKDRENQPGDETDLMHGVVTSASPLKIKVENRFEINSKFIVLTAPVRRKVVRCTCPDGGSQIEIFRDLRAGDKVIMLRVQRGQKYVVLDRG